MSSYVQRLRYGSAGSRKQIDTPNWYKRTAWWLVLPRPMMIVQSGTDHFPTSDLRSAMKGVHAPRLHRRPPPSDHHTLPGKSGDQTAVHACRGGNRLRGAAVSRPAGRHAPVKGTIQSRDQHECGPA